MISRNILVPFLLLSICAEGAFGESLAAVKLNKIAAAAHGELGVCVSDVATGESIYAYRAEVPLKPASIQKLFTSAAVLEQFGPESHLATEIYIAGRRGSSAKTIYLRGLGDPSLTTESLGMLARKVRQHGIRKIDEVRFDDSAFDGEKEREGQRAYLGGTSALAFNFNALAAYACPTSVGDAAVIGVEPFELELVASGVVKTVGRGESAVSVNESSLQRYQLSGQVVQGEACEEVYRRASDPAAMAAEFFVRQLSMLGVVAPKTAVRGVVASHAELLIRAPSKPLHEIVYGMNHWSTNVIAEQLLMTLGGPTGRKLDRIPLGSALTLDTAVNRLNAYAERFGGAKGVVIVDGAGLSHKNRVPPALFCKLLTHLQAEPAIATEFLHSLPVSGRSGTLRERNFDLPIGHVRAKTGTLDGVSSLAGYLVTKRGNKYAFGIVQNSSVSKGEAVNIENRIVQALYHDGER